jgi:hypothetical protein
MNETIFNDFSKWLNALLENNTFENIVAFNFNLYEGFDEYHIQLIGSDQFDEDDSDWAASEVFSSKENIFKIDAAKAGEKWYKALDFCIKLVIEYLENGKNKDKILQKKAAGIGFVDGDLYLLYNNGNVNKDIKIEYEF